MAAIEITISGVCYDKLARTTRPIVIIGEASLTGLGVGGGPIIPPSDPGAHPEHPIFYPPRPEHPIFYPPHPEHPIVLPPDKPTDPPTEPPTNPADPAWSWCWNPNTGWIPAYVSEGKPHPIPPPVKK